MKIRFLRSLTVDVEKIKLGEVWDKSFNRWDEIVIENIFPNGSLATLKTSEGDFILGVPLDSFEKLKEEKKVVTL